MKAHVIPKNRSALEDWHPAEVVCALRLKGWSLRRLAKSHGYHPGSFSPVLRSPWPRAERIIAEAIGLKPEQIWPSRYPRPPRGRRPRSSA